MKSAFLSVSSITLIPNNLLYDGIQNLEIINLSKDLEEEYHTPGTAFFSSENSNSNAGPAYTNSLGYSFPSRLLKEKHGALQEVGAIVIGLTNEKEALVFYKNDYFSNTKIIPSIKSDLDLVSVEFKISTLLPL